MLVEFERFVDMRQQGDQVLAAAEIDVDGIAPGGGLAAAAVAAVGMNRHHAGGRFDAFGRLHLDGQAVFVIGPVDPDLVADHQRGQQRQRTELFEVHTARPSPPAIRIPRLALHNQRASVKPAPSALDPGRVCAKSAGGNRFEGNQRGSLG